MDEVHYSKNHSMHGAMKRSALNRFMASIARFN